MRYLLLENTLFIRGSFRAVSTRVSGGAANVSTILNHTIRPGKKQESLQKELELIAAGAGIGRDFIGLVTTAPMQNLCVLQYDFITVFITAGITPGKGERHSSVSIIVCSGQGMGDAALLETIAVATEAREKALAGSGFVMTGSPPDAIVVACEGADEHRDAGALTPIGTRVRAAILQGVPEAIRRHGNGKERNRPSFFIFSRFRGEHWVEWTPENCPYYPCHFPGQRCDFCYCPLYPCGDGTLGQWAESSNGGKVWNCAQCTMIHEPVVAEYLQRHPDASKGELVRVWKAQKK